MFDARFKYSVEGDMYSVYLIATERGVVKNTKVWLAMLYKRLCILSSVPR